jgi:hypothetical protein
MMFFLILSSNSVYSQNVQRSGYDINDPRNPDCPCHKLQKLADDEYERKKLEFPDPGRGFNFNVKKELADNSSAGKNKISYYSGKRKRNRKMQDFKFRLYKMRSATRKARPDFSVCYKW